MPKKAHKKAAAKSLIEVSLRPYVGRLFIARTIKAYEKAHTDIFKEPDVLSCVQAGRFSGGCGKDDKWTYLVYASSAATMAHELAHVIFHVFELCGIDPKEGGTEPFCYMLSQLMLEAWP